MGSSTVNIYFWSSIKVESQNGIIPSQDYKNWLSSNRGPALEVATKPAAQRIAANADRG
jgi:hypothetical protein